MFTQVHQIRGVYLSTGFEEICTPVICIEDKYAPLQSKIFLTSTRGVYFSNRFEEIYTPAMCIKDNPCNQRYLSHLDQFTGFSALQVAAGGSVGRQELDLKICLKFDILVRIYKNLSIWLNSVKCSKKIKTFKNWWIGQIWVICEEMAGS